MKAMLRRSLATVVGSVTLLFASAAFAEGEACYNDDDCPNPACGGDVCNWAKTATKPDGMKVFYCQAAGKDPKGQDGWCTTDANCKCKASGATCNTGVHHCTDTGTPAASGGSGGSGGSTSAAGSTSGGSTSAAGTSSSGGTATKPASSSSDSGGCTVAAPGRSSSLALAVGALGLGLAFARRRRG